MMAGSSVGKSGMEKQRKLHDITVVGNSVILQDVKVFHF